MCMETRHLALINNECFELSWFIFNYTVTVLPVMLSGPSSSNALFWFILHYTVTTVLSEVLSEPSSSNALFWFILHYTVTTVLPVVMTGTSSSNALVSTPSLLFSQCWWLLKCSYSQELQLSTPLNCPENLVNSVKMTGVRRILSGQHSVFSLMACDF